MTTSRLAQARAAVRPALKARLMISGPTGAGKTWTALKIAEVLAEGGKILVIDTEKESALTYADTFTFVHLPWLPPFEPRELARTMAEAGHEYAVVIVDSTSHFWRKEGGTLDIAGGKFTGWKDARPAQEDLVQALLDCHAHVILCTRSKMEHVQEEINGRHVVRKVGMAPQQDDDLEYELNISIEMDMDHRATVAKSRADAVQVGRSFTAGHEVELAALYADWLKGGEPPAAQPVVDDLVARMNALPPAERVACKTEFVEAFGRPDGLRESRVPEAEGLVARFEGRGGGGGDEPGSGSAAAPPPPEHENPTQKGGGDDDSTGKGSPGSAPAAAGPDERSGEVESEPPPPRQGEGGASASPSQSGVTAEQLLELVTGAPATRKGKVQRAGVSVAQALGLPVPTSIDDVIADQTLAVAVLADLRGDDRPPPPGSGGGQDPAVGEQPSPPEASASGSAPAAPAPTAAPNDDPVALKTQNASDWRKENARCQALAAEHLSGDPETLKSQREALAYQASGGRVTSWSDVTRLEFSQIRSWLSYIADGHGRLVESNVAEHFGWHVLIEEAA